MRDRRLCGSRRARARNVRRRRSAAFRPWSSSIGSEMFCGPWRVWSGPLRPLCRRWAGMRGSDPMKGGKTQTGVGPGLKPRRRRWWRVGRYGLGGVGWLVALLVAARVALPWYLVQYLNRLLDRSPDYDGYVASVDVHLWRGAYTMHDVKINRISHAVPVHIHRGHV